MDRGAGGGGSQQAMAAFYFPLNPCQPVGMIAFMEFWLRESWEEPGGADKWGVHTGTSQAFGALLE